MVEILEMDSRGVADWLQVKSEEETAEEGDPRYVAWAAGWIVESCTETGGGSSLQPEEGTFGPMLS